MAELFGTVDGSELKVESFVNIQAHGSKRVGRVQEISKSGRRALVFYQTNGGQTNYTVWMTIPGKGVEKTGTNAKHDVVLGDGSRWTFNSKGAATRRVNETIQQVADARERIAAGQIGWNWALETVKKYGEPTTWTIEPTPVPVEA